MAKKAKIKATTKKPHPKVRLKALMKQPSILDEHPELKGNGETDPAKLPMVLADRVMAKAYSKKPGNRRARRISIAQVLSEALDRAANGREDLLSANYRTGAQAATYELEAQIVNGFVRMIRESEKAKTEPIVVEGPVIRIVCNVLVRHGFGHDTPNDKRGYTSTARP